jgi:hypothetical protein
MIRLQSVLIEEFRGIRHLALTFDGKNFAICGRNGTGKSGVVDAIEFVLTGNISRLSGEGSDKLSVKAHAPHVDSRNNPERARVTITATIPSLNKTVTVMRSVAQAKTPVVSPADADVLAALRQIEEHPELVLTRREIIRYILATEGDRAQEVQAVLKLDRLEEIRSELRSIANSASKEAKSAQQAVDTAVQGLVRASRIPRLSEADLRSVINAQRQILGLASLAAITATTLVKEGIATPSSPQLAAKILKSAATQSLTDLNSLMDRVARAPSEASFRRALDSCADLGVDPDALRSLVKDKFLESGRQFIDDNRCPFCDKEWEPNVLREHVAEKLKALQAVRDKRTAAEGALKPYVSLLSELSEALETVSRYCLQMTPPEPNRAVLVFKANVDKACSAIAALLPLADTIAVLNNLPSAPVDARRSLQTVEGYVNALPEPSKEDGAREYLIVCQEKLETYGEAQRAKKAADAKAVLAAQVLDVFSKTSDAALTDLYKSVEKDFAKMYGELHAPDEARFEAKLVPSLGKLGFDVDFYGKGFFPPGAYHSEGHQDAMGLCLYLALMSHVLKENFLFAVLDDVLMSVDAGHRRAVCSVLKKRFPYTQFILTTHDPVWLNHMRTEGLITARSLIHFHSWDVSTGPAFWDDVDVWEQIDAELRQDRVPVAAELLRNYLEYISAEICHRLRARVEFRLDAQMELGGLLPPAYERLGHLLAKGKAAANSWGNSDLRAALANRHDSLKQAKAAASFDQWQVNAAVHYNSWASLQKGDFQPLVDKFRAFVDRFRCPEPECQSFLTVLREGPEDVSVGCPCGKSTFGLRVKAAG